MTPNKHQSVGRQPRAALASASLLVLATLISGAAGAAQPAAGAGQLLLDHATPLSDAELAELRGGFITPDGLQISIGFRLELDIDDRLMLATEFTPQWTPASNGGGKQHKPGKSTGWKGFAPGELRLTLQRKGGSGNGSVQFAIGPSGDVEVLNGSPQVQEIDGGKRYAFEDGVAAEVANGGQGTRVTAGGDLPVVLTQTKNGLELSVGDESTTAVLNRITRDLISSRLVNRQDHAQVDQRLNVDVNLLNFSDTGHVRSLRSSSLHVLKLVNGGLVRAMTPR